MPLSIHKWLLVSVLIPTALYMLSRRKKIQKKRCIQFVTIILTMFSGLRSWKMGDVYHYCYAFLECNTDSFKLNFQSHDSVGIQLLFRVVGQLHLGFEVCLFLIAAFSAVTLGILIYKYSTSPYLSYLLYICLGNYIFTFSVLKQTIAMGFVTLAMIAIIQKKPIRFLVFTGIAALFHTPASIFFIAYIVAHKKRDAWYFVLLIVVAICIVSFRSEIVSFVSDLYYESETKYGATEAIGGKFIAILLIMTGATVLHPVNNKDVVYGCFFNMTVLALLIQSFSVYDNVFTRLADYYFQFFIIYIPLVLDSKTDEFGAVESPESSKRLPYTWRTLATFVITVLGVIFYSHTLEASWSLLSGFRFVWSSDTSYTLNLLSGG